MAVGAEQLPGLPVELDGRLFQQVEDTLVTDMAFNFMGPEPIRVRQHRTAHPRGLTRIGGLREFLAPAKGASPSQSDRSRQAEADRRTTLEAEALRVEHVASGASRAHSRRGFHKCASNAKRAHRTRQRERSRNALALVEQRESYTESVFGTDVAIGRAFTRWRVATNDVALKAAVTNRLLAGMAGRPCTTQAVKAARRPTVVRSSAGDRVSSAESACLVNRASLLSSAGSRAFRQQERALRIDGVHRGGVAHRARVNAYGLDNDAVWSSRAELDHVLSLERATLAELEVAAAALEEAERDAMDACAELVGEFGDEWVRLYTLRRGALFSGGVADHRCIMERSVQRFVDDFEPQSDREWFPQVYDMEVHDADYISRNIGASGRFRVPFEDCDALQRHADRVRTQPLRRALLCLASAGRRRRDILVLRRRLENARRYKRHVWTVPGSGADVRCGPCCPSGLVGAAGASSGSSAGVNRTSSDASAGDDQAVAPVAGLHTAAVSSSSSVGSAWKWAFLVF